MTFFHKYWQRIDVLIKKSLSSSSSLSLLLFHPNSESRINDRIRKAKTKKKKKKMMKLFKSQSLNTSVYMCICVSRTKILHFFLSIILKYFFLSSRHDDLIQRKKNRNYFSFDWTHTHTIGEKVSESWNFFFLFFWLLTIWFRMLISLLLDHHHHHHGFHTVLQIWLIEFILCAFEDDSSITTTIH